MTKRGFGWKKDRADGRDHHYAAPRVTAAPLPSVVDLAPQMPPGVYDQGDTNSCVGHGIAALIEHRIRQQGLDDWFPSPAFIYWNARALEDATEEDGGCEIRDGIKSVVKLGACYNDDWPLDVKKITEKPAAKAYADARTHLIKQYQRVGQTLGSIRTCLAAGNPIVFGFNVYPDFESDEVAASGIVPMPKGVMTGGHAVVLVGYSDHYQRFKVRNSYGPKWGLGGYFFIDYAYVTDPKLSADFWAIQAI